ncbi:MAG: hypothetical protein J6126_02435, partial [Clostridia bacterium]|nr:hypothetical protein [Clostridia bacterium]
MKTKRTLLLLLLAVLFTISAFCLFACNKNRGNGNNFSKQDEQGIQGDKGVGIAKAYVNETGELILTFTDGSTINAGKIKDFHGHEIIEKEYTGSEPTCSQVGT